ncbi:MAG: hypothetical protein WA610_10730 [Thermodesulfovibrionales bacterium]
MDIAGTFKDSIEVAKKNPLIFVPTVAVGLVMAVLTMAIIGGAVTTAGMMGGMGSPAGVMGAVGAAMGLAALLSIVGMIAGLIAHGMTVAMAQEAIASGTTTLNTGLSVVTSRLVQLVVAAVLVGLAVGIGMMLLVIPGIIAAFLFMFTFVIIIADNIPAVDAMKKSFELVKANLADLVILFIAVIGIGIVISIVNRIFRIIPVVGPLAGSLLMGIFGGYMTIVIVKVYKGLTTKI